MYTSMLSVTYVEDNQVLGGHGLMVRGYLPVINTLAKGLDICIERHYNGVKGLKATVENRSTFVADEAVIAVLLSVLKLKSIKFEPKRPDWKEPPIADIGYLGVIAEIFHDNFAYTQLKNILPDASPPLRIPEDNLFFAGEATSMSYTGYFHGGFSTGLMAAEDCRMRVLKRYGAIRSSFPAGHG
ncbi:hypothetical protein FEM48_Zijuj01G0163800 [Ziziphus jujuba var. spinosa]|uniref:Amine oxidase domain-containing protein n=1 Tax=Ziziphus jujuba var. spinosa TaxID=714518 RepID=A0A978W2A6_ZIZJJ|nr:hypothetical protein FEM48_Zijuj01G0163800 [Ziziphus jujuba var. spinosa]